MESVTPKNVLSVISNLKTKKSTELSDSYKRNVLQYIIRLKRDAGDSTWKLNKEERKRIRISAPRTRVTLTQELFSFFIDATQYAILYVPSTPVPDKRSWLDLIIAIVMITTTNCTVPVLSKLTYNDLQILYQQGEVSNIKKTAYYDYLLPHINMLIQTRNTLYAEELQTPTKNLANFAITCHTDVINKRFQELYVQRVRANPPKHNLGLIAFRRANFTELTRAVWTPTFITSLTKLGRPAPPILSA